MLIGNRLAWAIGNGKQVRIGVDPWVGLGESYKLLEHLISMLHDNGIFALSDVALVSMDRARENIMEIC
jgi:hypothetical protein